MQACYQDVSPVSIRKIFPEAVIYGGNDYIFLNCTCDTRQINCGDVYVAVLERECDSHALIREAVSSGAAAVVVDKNRHESDRLFLESLKDNRGKRVLVCVVDNTRKAYARMCEALFRNPGKHLQLIGVTGTSGKSCTGCLIAGVLGAAGHTVGISGTLGIYDGVEASGRSMDSFPPKRASSWLARMYENDCSHAVVEVSSSALDQYRLEGLDFKTVCFTNVRKDHLDYHGSLERYRAAKMRMFEYVAPDGFTVLNMDDPILKEAVQFLDYPTLTYALNRPAEITGAIIEQYPSEQTLLISAGGETLPLRTRIIGKHHAYNCLAAAAVGLGLGVSLINIVRGLESVEMIPGRMERIECGQRYSVFVDAASTPDALENTLLALKEVVPGRLICVYGVTPQHSSVQRAMMGRVVAQYASASIITADNPGMTFPEVITSDILKGYKGKKRKPVIIWNRTAAIEKALSVAREGDCVIICGKGHEKYQLIGTEMMKHDDREVARQWLYGNAVKVIKK